MSDYYTDIMVLPSFKTLESAYGMYGRSGKERLDILAVWDSMGILSKEDSFLLKTTDFVKECSRPSSTIENVRRSNALIKLVAKELKTRAYSKYGGSNNTTTVGNHQTRPQQHGGAVKTINRYANVCYNAEGEGGYAAALRVINNNGGGGDQTVEIQLDGNAVIKIHVPEWSAEISRLDSNMYRFSTPVSVTLGDKTFSSREEAEQKLTLQTDSGDIFVDLDLLMHTSDEEALAYDRDLLSVFDETSDMLENGLLPYDKNEKYGIVGVKYHRTSDGFTKVLHPPSYKEEEEQLVVFKTDYSKKGTTFQEEILSVSVQPDTAVDLFFNSSKGWKAVINGGKEISLAVNADAASAPNNARVEYLPLLGVTRWYFTIEQIGGEIIASFETPYIAGLLKRVNLMNLHDEVSASIYEIYKEFVTDVHGVNKLNLDDLFGMFSYEMKGYLTDFTTSVLGVDETSFTLRRAVIEKWRKEGRLDDDIVWHMDNDSNFFSNLDASNSSDVMDRLTRDENILGKALSAEILRVKSILASSSSKDARKLRDLDDAAKEIRSYEGPWSEHLFSINEAPKSVLRLKTIKKIVSDFISLGYSKQAKSIEEKPYVSLDTITDLIVSSVPFGIISKNRAAELVSKYNIKNISELEALCSGPDKKALTTSERTAILWRSGFVNNNTSVVIPVEEMDKWVEWLSGNVMGFPFFRKLHDPFQTSVVVNGDDSSGAAAYNTTVSSTAGVTGINNWTILDKSFWSKKPGGSGMIELGFLTDGFSIEVVNRLIDRMGGAVLGGFPDVKPHTEVNAIIERYDRSLKSFYIVARLSPRFPARLVHITNVTKPSAWPFFVAYKVAGDEAFHRLSLRLKNSAEKIELTPVYCSIRDIFSPADVFKLGDTDILQIITAAADDHPSEDEQQLLTDNNNKSVADVDDVIPPPLAIESIINVGKIKRAMTKTTPVGKDDELEFEVRFDSVTRSMFFAFINSIARITNGINFNKSNIYVLEESNVRKMVEDATATACYNEKKTWYTQSFTERGFRVSASTESPVSDARPYKDKGVSVRRERLRWGAVLENGVKVDASIVNTFFPDKRSLGGRRGGRDTTGASLVKAFTSYEVELEVNSIDALDALNESIKRVWHILYSTPHMYMLPERDNVFADFNHDAGGLSVKPFQIKTEFPAAVNARAKREKYGRGGGGNDMLYLGPSMIAARGIGAQARNLKLRDVTASGLGNGYTVSVKADGITRFLYIHLSGIWAISPPTYASLILPSGNLDAAQWEEYKAYVGTILAVEEIPVENRIGVTKGIVGSSMFVPFDTISYAESSPCREEARDASNNWPDGSPYNGTYLHRVSFANDLVTKFNSVMHNHPIIFRTKQFVDVGSTRASLKEALETVLDETLEFENDGLIFTPIYAPQKPHIPREKKLPLHLRSLSVQPDVCKFKPWENLTIDLAVDFAKRDLYTIGDNGSLVEFRGSMFNAFDPKHQVVWDHPKFVENMVLGKGNENVIFEMAPEILPLEERRQVEDGRGLIKHQTDDDIGIIGADSGGGLKNLVLVPSRLRFDKENPNGTEIAKDVFDDICNPLNMETLTGSDFKVLFKYNNQLKKKIFESSTYMKTGFRGGVPQQQQQRYPSANNTSTLLVDIGAGRGGDLGKYAKMVSSVVFVEPNMKNFTELRRRAEIHNFGKEPRGYFVNAGAEDTGYIVNAVNKALNDNPRTSNVVISMMLSLSFFWDVGNNKLKDLGRTLTAISTEVINAGISAPVEFLFFTIEGERTKELFMSKGTTSVNMGPVSMKITDDSSVWIDIKDSIVQDQTEYFVNLDDLKEWVDIKNVTNSMSEQDKLYLTQDEIAYSDLFVYGSGFIRNHHQITTSYPKDMEMISTSKQLLSSFTVSGDTFPYFRRALDRPEQMMSKLKREIAKPRRVIKAPYNKYKWGGSDILRDVVVRTFPSDFIYSDSITDHFSEHVRMECSFNGMPSPKDVWRNELCIKTSILGKSVLEQHAAVYASTKMCNNFNPVFCGFAMNSFISRYTKRKPASAAAVEESGGIKILDPSAGWGDRLISAIALEDKVSEYHGFDPNDALQPSYRAIVDMLKDGKDDNKHLKFRVDPIPFEDAILADSYYDLAITSPPFYDLETYVSKCNDEAVKQSTSRYNSYVEWKEKMYEPYLYNMYNAIKPGGSLFIYVSNYTDRDGRPVNLETDTDYIMSELLLAARGDVYGFHITEDEIGGGELVGAGKKIRWVMEWRKPLTSSSGGTLRTDKKPTTTASPNHNVLTVGRENELVAMYVSLPIPQVGGVVTDLKFRKLTKSTVATSFPKDLVSDFEDVSRVVNSAKSALDVYNGDSKMQKLHKEVNPFIALRDEIKQSFNGEIVTIAWLKMHEILSRYNILERLVGSPPPLRDLKVFCNAELPGAFVSAINQMCNGENVNLDWVASSLMPPSTTRSSKAANSSNNTALGDTYGLYAKHKSRWLMDEDMRGDLTLLPHVKELAARAKHRLGGEVDLYTSDVGVGVDNTNEYDKEEEYNAKVHLGQILTGLLCLKEGGVFVVKTYTFNKPFSFTLLALVSSFFTEFNICKPQTSKAYNSEVYLVGIGFKGVSKESIKVMSAALTKFNFENIFHTPEIPKKVYDAIKNASVTIHRHQQVNYLERLVLVSEEYKGKHVSVYHDDHVASSFAVRKAWLISNPVSVLNREKSGLLIEPTTATQQQEVTDENGDPVVEDFYKIERMAKKTKALAGKIAKCTLLPQKFIESLVFTDAVHSPIMYTIKYTGKQGTSPELTGMSGVVNMTSDVAKFLVDLPDATTTIPDDYTTINNSLCVFVLLAPSHRGKGVEEVGVVSILEETLNNNADGKEVYAVISTEEEKNSFGENAKFFKIGSKIMNGFKASVFKLKE